MDPSRDLCEVRDSFSSSPNKINKVPVYKEEVTISSPRVRRNNLLNKSGENTQGNTLEEIKKSRGIFSIVEEDIANLNITSQVFERSDIILANIDAIYNFSGQEDGYIKPQIIKNFDFVNLSEVGSYLTYLQYRLPFARGFLPCTNEKFLNRKYIDERNLNVACESDFANNFTSYVLEVVPEGVDLVISDKIDTKNNIQTKSEYRSHRDYNISMALKLCKLGGTFICKIDDTIKQIEAQYILVSCFETFSLFKPMSENLNNSYSYIIAQNFKGSAGEWIPLLDKSVNVPISFINFVNNYYTSLKDLRQELMQYPKRYDTYKCKAIWNIF